MVDYRSLGLRIGLEIHQQLDSGHKLFCKCPIKKSDEFPFSIERRLRPAAGELDFVDPAALYEFFKNKKFIYRYNPESSCLLELDEKPPDPINEKALETALKVARMLDARIVDEVHVMRKTVIDGSSVSGFQRTALIATNGKIETSFGSVRITTISLEEDAATPLKRESNFVEYRLDRLGVPLIEIDTDADIHTPHEARETAESIGMMLRSFPVVRGIGSIRQDVNISIEQGARVEIKGFQEIEKMEQMIDNEVQRQVSLLEIKKELEKRGVKKEDFIDPMDATKIFLNSSGFIGSLVKSGGFVYAIKLPKFASLLKKQCGDRTFGKELAGYAESFGFGGIIHSDEDVGKYRLELEFRQLRELMKADDMDLIAVIAGERNSAEKAMKKILERAAFCLIGVPEETRVADGIGSKYTRPLPGAGRMYPESDIPAVKIDKKYVEGLKLPKTIKEIENELKKIIPEEMAKQIVRSKYYTLFDEFKNFGPVIVATTFLSTYTDLRRKGFDVESISRDDLFKVFSSLQKGKIAKGSIPLILERVASGEEVAQTIESLSQLDEKEIEEIVRRIIKENEGKTESAIIGICMKTLQGRADGRSVLEAIRRINKK